MCLLYRTRTSRAEVARIFQTNRLDGPEALEKDYVSPRRPGWIVTTDMVLTARPFCRPHWQAGKQPIGNIRNTESPWWRDLVNSVEHRCLVPATSFSEWADQVAPGKKREPVWFEYAGHDDFAFAGIYHDDWFAFLTCEPNAEVAAVHKKAMPVILKNPDRWIDWLDGDMVGIIQKPLPDGSLIRL